MNNGNGNSAYQTASKMARAALKDAVDLSAEAWRRAETSTTQILWRMVTDIATEAWRHAATPLPPKGRRIVAIDERRWRDPSGRVITEPYIRLDDDSELRLTINECDHGAGVSIIRVMPGSTSQAQ